MDISTRTPEQEARIQKWLDKLLMRDIESVRAFHYYSDGSVVTCLDLNIAAPSVTELDQKVIEYFVDDKGELFEAAPEELWLEFIECSEWVENRSLRILNHGTFIVSTHRKSANG